MKNRETLLSRSLLLAALTTIFFAFLSCLPSLFVPIGLAAEGDALDYRVPLLKWILRHGAYPSWSWTFVDDYPMLGELLMLPFFAIKDEFARLVPIAAYFGCAAFGALIGTELLPEKETKPRRPLFFFLFASLLGLQPILVQAGHVMVDNIATCFALGALYFLLRRKLVPSALLLAAALATRYTIWGAAPGALAALFWLDRKAKPPAQGKKLGRYAAIAFLGALPFLLRNLIVNGNPVFPLLNGLFHGLPMDAFEGWGRGRDPLSLLLFPYDLLYTNTFVRELFDTKTLSNGFYVYKVGGLFYAQLAALVPALLWKFPESFPATKKALRKPKAQAIGLFALFPFAFWWLGSQQLRFLGCGMVLANVFLLYFLFRRLPPFLLAPFALLPILSIAQVQQEPWKIAFKTEESFRESGYVLSARRCFARSGVTQNSVVGFHDRNALVGYFDFDFVFLPPSNLAFANPGVPPPPAPDFIYSGLNFHDMPGYERWPREAPCLLKRK